ncbi:Magnesium transporter NIPA [Thermomonospora echinospora]|uniref:Magnesium transporter NIPA n=1 Tax=Thermomonospora echinospora TaxID=1992 RepID=A0A1H6E3W4_9ACTN|nr:DMT family transporter [Thermomonospora echinospora]SEG92340.1 Magnesium transporter NIPA [Thermomonospora echinospora]
MDIAGHAVGIIITLMAACLLGIGFVCQQHAAYQEPLREVLHIELILHLIRKPVWLLGIALMIGGQVLSTVAFSMSGVTAVEPLLAMTLVFALVFAHLIYRESFTLAAWCGAVLVCAGVSTFLLFGQPHDGARVPEASLRWLAAGLVVMAAATLVALGRRLRLIPRAILFASAAGMLYGVQDVLTRASLEIAGRGLGALFVTWHPYALVAVGATGLLLAQSAFDMAPLQVSLPASTAAGPVTGIVLAVVIFSERLVVTPVALTAEILGLIAMVTGILVLGRSPILTKKKTEVAAGSEARLP